MGRRAEKRVAMEGGVLDAAMAMISKEGLEGLTMARLAARLDISVGGLYRYYSGKDAIVAELEHRALLGFQDLQTERLAALDEEVDRAERFARSDPTGRPIHARARALARVMAAFEAYLDHAELDPAHHRLLDALMSTPDPLFGDALARAAEAWLAPILGRCAVLLSEAVAAGALIPGDGEVRTSALWAAIHGADHFRKRDRMVPEKLQARRVAAELIDSLLRGWGALHTDLVSSRRLATAPPPFAEAAMAPISASSAA